MTDIDNALRGAIRELADDVRPRPDLASTAMVSGRRLRARRRLRTTLAAAAAMACVAAGTPYLVGRPTHPPALPPAPPETTLPAAPGVPGAAQRPGLVASDAGILHFDVDGSVVPGLEGTRWESTAEGEWLTLFLDESPADAMAQVAVHLPPPGRQSRAAKERLERKRILIDGRPATLDRVKITSPGAAERGLFLWQLLWQPVDQLDVMVAGTGRTGDIVATVARALRFDRAQRCVQPVRATTVPPGTSLARCSIELDAAGTWRSASSFSVAAPMPLGVVQVTFGEPPAGRPANRTFDGRAATWSDESDMLIVYGYLGTASLTVLGESEESVTAFVRGFSPAGDLRNVRAWPDPL